MSEIRNLDSISVILLLTFNLILLVTISIYFIRKRDWNQSNQINFGNMANKI